MTEMGQKMSPAKIQIVLQSTAKIINDAPYDDV